MTKILERLNLNNYFNFHVCLSFLRPLSSVLHVSVCRCVRKITQIPAVLSQNFTNKSCLVCVMSEKYASWVTLRPQWDRYRQGETKVCLLNFKMTWLEFQKTSQTAPEWSEAELCTLYFQTTLAEFQKPSQTATERGEAELRIPDFHGQIPKCQVKRSWTIFKQP